MACLHHMAGMADAPDSQATKVITLGCRLNAYESDVIAQNARDVEDRGAVVINTCAVTNDAVAESRRQVRKAKRDNPNAHNALPLKSQSRSRAFLQVQNGCDHRCTFCIIPYGRGNSRSVPAGEIVGSVKSLVRQGFNEVVLTGVDLSSWGGDLPGTPPLGDLVRRILKLVPELPRLRLSSIDPAEVDDVLFDLLVTEARMSPYLHLSLQSGDDMILKRMKRRHSRADAINLCRRLKTARPAFTFGADIIAGFPTETDEMFENSVSAVSEIGIPWLHVFPYSAREGTPAAKIPPINGNIVKARAKALRDAGADRTGHWLRKRKKGFWVSSALNPKLTNSQKKPQPRPQPNNASTKKWPHAWRRLTRQPSPRPVRKMKPRKI